MNHEAGRLKVAVMGAGSIGCYLGGQLASSCDVTLIGRASVLDPIGEHGLTLGYGSRVERTVPASALTLTTDPAGIAGAEVVLVTVKSRHTADAVRSLLPHLSDSAYAISLQNGLRNPARIRGILPVPVLTGMVGYNVVQPKPASFHRATSGEVLIDDAPIAQPFVAATKEAGVNLRPRSDMIGVQHAKLLLNLNNALNALSGLPLKVQLSQRDHRRSLALCQEEALAVFAAVGVTPARLTPTSPSATIRLLRAPDSVFRTLAATSLKVDPTARSSMADDLRLGRPTEIDELQGEISRLGLLHGIPTAANDRVVELVHAAEAAGPSSPPSWSGADLIAELNGIRTR